MYKIIAPYSITIPRKTKEWRKYAMNLNWYRNWSFHESNAVKKLYLNAVVESINKLPHFSKIWIIYKPYYSRWWKHDKWNVLSVSQKFFLDALVETETIDDDSDIIVDCELFLPWDVDKDNERVEIFIFDNKREYKEYIKKHL